MDFGMLMATIELGMTDRTTIFVMGAVICLLVGIIVGTQMTK